MERLIEEEDRCRRVVVVVGGVLVDGRGVSSHRLNGTDLETPATTLHRRRHHLPGEQLRGPGYHLIYDVTYCTH